MSQAKQQNPSDLAQAARRSFTLTDNETGDSWELPTLHGSVILLVAAEDDADDAAEPPSLGAASGQFLMGLVLNKKSGRVLRDAATAHGAVTLGEKILDADLFIGGDVSPETLTALRQPDDSSKSESEAGASDSESSAGVPLSPTPSSGPRTSRSTRTPACWTARASACSRRARCSTAASR